MIRLFFVTMALFFTVCSFAQRVNSYGQKVVSEILIKTLEKDGSVNTAHKYVYTYTDDLKLKGIKYYWGNELKEEFILNNDILTRKQYDDLYSDVKWEYDFDIYGNIAKATEYSYGSDGSITKYEYNYTYEYSEEHKWWQLVGSGWTEWYKPKNSKCFYKQELAPHYEYQYIDDICYEKGISQRDIKNREKFFNFNAKNDTNIDIYRIIDRYAIFIGTRATEWERCRHEYLPKDFYGTPYEYKYYNGNLVEIQHEHWLRIYIKYLY